MCVCVCVCVCMCVCVCVVKKIIMLVPDEYSLTSAKSVRVHQPTLKIAMGSTIYLINQEFTLVVSSFQLPGKNPVQFKTVI